MQSLRRILERVSFSKFTSYERLNLDDDDSVGGSEKTRPPSHWHLQVRRRIQCSIGDGLFLSLNVFQFVLSCVLLVGTFSEYRHRGPSSRLFPTPLYSPANEAIEYRVQQFQAGFISNRSIYQGPPNEELDAAWEDLYSFGISSVPQHEAAKMPNLTVPIPDEPGHFVIELDVFHELHCLNMIRKTFYPDSYPPMTPPDGTAGTNASLDTDLLLGWTHIDHCIDSIRQSIMCMADVSTIVYVWSDAYNMSLPNGQVMHTCRNFEKLQDWARERQVDVLDTERYVHNVLEDVVKQFWWNKERGIHYG